MFRHVYVVCLCCLPTPMTLASGGSPMFPLVVHQPASPSIWPAVQSLRRGLSTNLGDCMFVSCVHHVTVLNFWPGFSVRLFCFVQAKTVCRYDCMYFWSVLVLVCVDVMVRPSA